MKRKTLLCSVLRSCRVVFAVAILNNCCAVVARWTIHMEVWDQDNKQANVDMQISG